MEADLVDKPPPPPPKKRTPSSRCYASPYDILPCTLLQSYNCSILRNVIVITFTSDRCLWLVDMCHKGLNVNITIDSKGQVPPSPQSMGLLCVASVPKVFTFHLTFKIKAGNWAPNLSSVISGICHSVNEVFALLGCYTVLVGSWLLSFWGSLLIPSSRVKQSRKTLEDRTDRLSRNVSNEQPINAVLHPRRVKTSVAVAFPSLVNKMCIFFY
jgi:hypothetical protein